MSDIVKTEDLLSINHEIPELERSVGAYTDVPFIGELCDIMAIASCREFTKKHSKKKCDWDVVGTYIRLYDDLMCFYHEYNQKILALYSKIGGNDSNSDVIPSKEVMAWMMATVMRNSKLRTQWFKKDRDREKTKTNKKKRISISYTSFTDSILLDKE